MLIALDAEVMRGLTMLLFWRCVLFLVVCKNNLNKDIPWNTYLLLWFCCCQLLRLHLAWTRCQRNSVGRKFLLIKVKAWFKTEYLSAKHLTDATEVISQKYLDCSNNQMAEVQTLSYLSGRLTEKELSKNIQYKYYPSIAATQPYMDMFFRTCW